MKTNIVSVVLAAGALALAIWNERRARAAEERLNNLRSSHYRLSDQMRSEHQTFQSELNALKAQLRTASGAPLFDSTMTVREAIELDPRAADVMAAFHIGGCSSCAVSADDTLQFAAEGNGQSAQRLVAALNKLGTSDADHVQAMLERRPNVEIAL